MYSLLGFVQVLLMLTQSRLVPNLDFVWSYEHVANERITKPLSDQPALQLPNTVAYKVYRDAIQRKRKEQWAQRTGWKPRRRFQLPSLQASRYTTKPVNKLYLVFCQLKTEG